MSPLLLASLLLALDAGRVDPPPDGHFIVDATGTLRAATLAEVDELASTIHVGGFGELMVLVVETTGKTPALRYGVDTFAGWPVGHAENVDGALLVIALRDKRAAVVLGDGYGRIEQQELDAMIASSVTPALNESRNDDAVKAGAKAMLRLLEKHHLPVLPDEVPPATVKPFERPRSSPHATPGQTEELSSWRLVASVFTHVLPFVWLVFGVVVVVLLIQRRGR